MLIFQFHITRYLLFSFPKFSDDHDHALDQESEKFVPQWSCHSPMNIRMAEPNSDKLQIYSTTTSPHSVSPFYQFHISLSYCSLSWLFCIVSYLNHQSPTPCLAFLVCYLAPLECNSQCGAISSSTIVVVVVIEVHSSSISCNI